MRAFVLVVLALAPLGASLAGAGAGTVTVHFFDALGAPDLGLAPRAKACDVTVAAGADGGAVLDAATAIGCISGWKYCAFDGLGDFVTEVDGISGDSATLQSGESCSQTIGTGLFLTFWAIELNGASATTGIRGYAAAEGDTYGFVYTSWLLP